MVLYLCYAKGHFPTCSVIKFNNGRKVDLKLVTKDWKSYQEAQRSDFLKHITVLVKETGNVLARVFVVSYSIKIKICDGKIVGKANAWWGRMHCCWEESEWA